MKTTEFFEKHNYVLVKNFIPKVLADYLYRYSRIVETSAKVMVDTKFPKYDLELFGKFGDGQVPGTFYRYADPAFDTLLVHSVPAMEFVTGMVLQPTYSYWRMYKKDDILKRHRDRPSCEISATLCLGYDTSNVEDKQYNWPMWIDETGSLTNEGKPIHMEPGDCIIYKGSKVDHWRLPFEGERLAQVFLHYSDQNGPFAQYTKYDARPFVGLPGYFRNQEKIDKASEIGYNLYTSQMQGLGEEGLAEKSLIERTQRDSYEKSEMKLNDTKNSDTKDK